MSEFEPPRLLRNAHVQSILASLRFRRPWVRRRAAALLAASEEIVLDCGEGVRLQGFHSGQGRAGEPLVVLLHGWEGGADSLYVLSAGAELHAAGFAVFRLNLRDHGATQQLNRELFHSCRVDEVVGAVRAIQDRFRPSFLGMAGHSLGGNFTLRVAARAPAAGIRLAQTVAVCPVLDPAVTMARLETGWFAYREYFRRKWGASLRKKAAHYPEAFDVSVLPELKTLTTMTAHFVEEHTPYPSLADYFAGYAITGERLAGLQVPSAILISEDDPIIPARDLARLAQNPNLRITRTRYGGHCGFVDSLRGPSWTDKRIRELFVAALART
ncbi:MAG: alpha/beta fold hydrolase [Gammaproteobacteria bacterium]|nr:alpha/beta fold hydrolase [Gammaproteobacteria bacterium]